MLKKILIGLGVLVVILAVFMFWANNRNRTLSPPGSTELELSNGLAVSVDYSRPSVRDRVIFGTEAEGALQPHGVYWRMGANEPTLLTVNKDFNLNGIPVSAGSYDFYAIPSKEGFELRLNSGTRFWGYTEPDYSLDILKTTVGFTKPTSTVEQYTIQTLAAGDGIKVVCSWANRQWEVLITAQ